MSAQSTLVFSKRARPASNPPTSSLSSPLAKKRAVHRRTVEKWITENDRAMNTGTWLKFEMADRNHVAVLKCAVCSQFKAKLESMRNYRPAFIDGTSNVRVRTSTFKEYASTDMHCRAMILFKKERATNPCDYAPIARALAETSVDAATVDSLKRKFDVAYMITKGKNGFHKDETPLRARRTTRSRFRHRLQK